MSICSSIANVWCVQIIATNWERKTISVVSNYHKSRGKLSLFRCIINVSLFFYVRGRMFTPGFHGGNMPWQNSLFLPWWWDFVMVGMCRNDVMIMMMMFMKIDDNERWWWLWWWWFLVKKFIIAKEVISCDVSPAAMFLNTHAWKIQIKEYTYEKYTYERLRICKKHFWRKTLFEKNTFNKYPLKKLLK